MIAIEYIRSGLVSAGWPMTGCPASEVRLAWFLQQAGVEPSDVHCQFKLGRWRLDFAFVRARIAVEADGWVHTAANVQAKDKARDAELKSWGWVVVRVNTDEEETLAEQVRTILHAKGEREREMDWLDTIDTSRLKFFNPSLKTSDLSLLRTHPDYHRK